jgi:hypothetical protein
VTSPAPDRADAIDPDTLILAGRVLRAGTALESTSRYGADTWRLEPAILQQHVATAVLSFSIVPTRYRDVAKELCFAMMCGPLPPGEKQQSLNGLRSTFNGVRKFLCWLDTRPHTGTPRYALADLIEADLVAYHQHLLATPMTDGSRENSRRAVSLFWRYRNCLSDPLRVNPRTVEGWTFRRSRARENTTGRIPESVLGPLIAWATRFVDDFSTDILAAATCREQFQARFNNGRYGRNSGVTTELETYLDAHLRSRCPLPGLQGRPYWRFIALAVGSHDEGLRDPRLRRLVEQTAAEVGVTDHTWLPHTIVGRVDGRPWIEGIALRHPSLSVEKLTRMLHVACYILIAFLSGMRDSEVKHLRRDCLTAIRDADGIAYRWKVHGLAFKGEADPAGVAATWIIGAAAARAIAVVERLQPADEHVLFADMRSGAAATEASRERAQSTKTTSSQLAEFVDWINTYCTEHSRTDAVPLVNQQQWVLSTRQFRRTLAWFIARRPGGSIAGAIQYRHLSIQMFEGYAGTSDSGFRAEVEAEQALARGEQLFTLIDTHEHASLRGPSAQEAHQRLTDLGDRSGFAGTVVTDPHRLKRIMRQHDPAIYPGTFATCVFNPDKALCHPRNDSRGTTVPALGDCRPLQCGNVALSDANVAALTTEREHVAQELVNRPDLPPLLTHRLRERHNQISTFLHRHTEAEQ